MLQNLDNALKAVLDDSSAPPELRNADVNFETPGSGFNPPLETISLFLYDLQENRDLRDPVPIMQMSGGVYAKRLPPLRLECTYLVTSWATQLAGAVRAAREHLLLGQALLWLSRFPVIPPQYFAAGGLANPPFPPPNMVAQMDSNRNAGEFWSALGTPPRPAFQIKVTIALDLLLQVAEGPPVVSKEMLIKEQMPPGTPQPVLETWFEIGGLVRQTLNKNPIPNAQVILLERGWTTTTDTEGKYRFTLLDGGNYTIRASAAGFPSTDKPVKVPGNSLDEYVIDL